MSASPAPVFGLDPFWLASALLCLTYALVVVERLDRSVVALLGGGLMILLGIVDQKSAIAAQDFNTLALLIGMMLLVALIRPCGMFQYLAFAAARAARGHPGLLLVLFTLATAVLSSMLNNATTVLMIAPVTLVVAQTLRLAPYPFLFSEIMASNIGGTATLIGDPPNMLIGSATGLGFNAFLMHLAPAAAIVLLVQILIGHLLWGRRMRVDGEARALVLSFRPSDAVSDRPLLLKSVVVIGLAIAGFVFGERLGLAPGSIAVGAAALLMLLDNWRRPLDEQSRRVHAAFGEVEWITIFFLVGLFVVVAGVERAGVLSWLAARIGAATAGNRTLTTLLVLWASALLSAAIDNIPFVATMIPVIKSLGPSLGGDAALQPVWWALAYGAFLGGNGTLIGATANLTVAGIAERNGIPFGFLSFLRLAFPMMLVSIAIGMVYFYLRYLL
jgi:Na+/H+ antiporter NhaD/arsenite permease-like protein